MATVREREDKYEVPPGFSVTDGLMPLLDGGTRVVQREQVIDNAYFDTPDRALLRHRVTHRLLGRDESPLVEVADDTVQATVGDANQEWREVEVELGESGDEKLLAFVGKRLRRAGATPSPHPSKLARVLPADTRPDDEPLTAYLRKQYERLIAEDLGFRRGQSDVHDARVAIRRLRSTLRTFRPLFEAGSTQRLDAELRWFAGLLGEVRDREVLRSHLDGALDALPAAMILGPVRARVDEHLLSEAVHHQVDVDEALGGERYLALLDRLERLVREPPLRRKPSTRLLRKRADTAARNAMRRLDRALDGDPDAMDAALHQARKQAKRARYAAELVRPIVGKRAKKQARRFEKLQDILGEHQDSVVTSALLHDLGRRAGSAAGENGFTYGLLLCREQHRAATAREHAFRWHRRGR